ncbi:LacI family DNA-binding transcriptional regulator [Actinacidiphila oryziradicis]|uniref:LacI family DNA-binding transcriptional regulator n=1 Tax=Actinacidiphila oryziradicis TaxID=2571141 RepID=A0A4U0SL77_9ACTN|nr:substrate-binding domain-containing protein [Actinacidiphila oryziradicis]TKA08891.1 LacI family DNA-binding transcriptional regulator [Actinacidiphila oryziradicis]
MEQKANGPTLAQVAFEAGVSVPTVSKVLNGREDVAAQTRQHVDRVLQRMGYRHRRPTLSSKKRQSLTVDLVVHSLESTWTSAVLAGAEAAAQEADLHLNVNAMLGRARHTRTARGWLDRIALRGTAGVITNLAHVSGSELAWFEQHAIPYVMIDPSTVPPPETYWVTATNWEGGRDAVQHLLDLGHRRIAVIAGRQHRHCSQLRLEGYRSAMRAAHVRIGSGFIKYGGFDLDSAAARMDELLDLPKPPTAVFVCSDMMALGALRTIQARGLDVPGVISVVGFDDLPESRWSSPQLTTVRQPLAEMGATAVRTLVRIMNGDRPDSRRTELSTRLILRSSTAAGR